MRSLFKRLVLIMLLVPILVSVGGCPCGFDCSSDDPIPTSLTLGFSDAALENLEQVVIEVDSISFRRSGFDDVVVDTFTISEQNLVGADTFQVDLLSYRGRNQLLVIEDLELETGTYSEIVITILGDDLNYSYVEESDGTLKAVNVAAAGLSLPGVQLVSGAQAFTVEFGLARALQYQVTADSYLLTNVGVRVEDNSQAASLTGRVNSSLFDTATPCDEKIDPESGNRIYIYKGTSVLDEQLADVYTSASANAVPDDAIAPFAVATLAENVLTGGWDYAFGFLPSGDYTLAFSCDSAGDDPIDYDGIVLPLPADQVYEINLAESEQAVCDLSDGGTCN